MTVQLLGSVNDPGRDRRTWRALSVVWATAAFSLIATPAFAHGIGGEAADRSILGFVPLGIEHMLLGWDHLLFIGGVVLLAREWRRAAKMITFFVLGHSATLIVATLAGWQVNAAAVDVVIALSVVFVGAVAVFKPAPRWDVFGYIVLGFGLIHGLGLATRLQALGLPEDGVLWRVIAFNVGIEIGQLTAIFGAVVIAYVVSTFAGQDREPALRKLAAAGLFVGGAAAASLVIFAAFTESDTTDPVAAATDTENSPGGCAVAESTMTFPPMGGHVERNFYEPTEETPLEDFGHSLGDGYVVVLYPETMAATEVDDLRALVASPDGEGLLAGPSPEGDEQVMAINAYDTMTCSSLDIEELQEFTTEWFETIR